MSYGELECPRAPIGTMRRRELREKVEPQAETQEAG
jgi:hypothetical protein